ncbi:MAG: LPS-assembly protein LptD, partial [Candidatus Latescibacterota bacterium]
MRPYAAVLTFVLFSLSGSVSAQNSPAKPVEFPGQAVSDSLHYTAREIDYDLGEKQAVMRGNATVKYLGYTLRSHLITYYQDRQYVIAEGRKDSTGALVDTPVFIDQRGDELRGQTVEYNLETGEGLVLGGKTKYENGFIGFDRVKRVSEDTLYISNGTYTTCETEGRPHYYFAGKQMKLIVDDKLIIKPITAYIHDIPVFWFPFYVFPISKGRQSGFLTPRWGSSRQDGRYLSNIGYYFAASDYWDYRVAATLRERNGWLLKNWVDYNVRYKMTGSVYGSFEERPREGSKQWMLRASHSHTVSPTLQITGDANFQSSQFSRYNSFNIYEQLNRNIRSSLNVTKRWAESGNSLIMNMSQEKNLDTQRSSTTLPSLSFRMPRRLLFGAGEEKSIQRKYVKTPVTENDPDNRKWYESIYYSFNTDFRNTNDIVEQAQIREGSYSRD